MAETSFFCASSSFFDLLLGHLDSFGPALFKEAVGGREGGRVRTIVRTVLAHEEIVRFGGNSHGTLQLSNLHLSGGQQGSKLPANLVAVRVDTSSFKTKTGLVMTKTILQLPSHLFQRPEDKSIVRSILEEYPYYDSCPWNNFVIGEIRFILFGGSKICNLHDLRTLLKSKSQRIIDS